MNEPIYTLTPHYVFCEGLDCIGLVNRTTNEDYDRQAAYQDWANEVERCFVLAGVNWVKEDYLTYVSPQAPQGE